jgi:hypothetical protein
LNEEDEESICQLLEETENPVYEGCRVLMKRKEEPGIEKNILSTLSIISPLSLPSRP